MDQQQYSITGVKPTDTTNLNNLEWSQHVLEEYIRAGLVAKPTDFTRSWQNGVGLLCLVHRVDASLVSDINVMHSWLSVPTAIQQQSRDVGGYLATLKHLKIVYSADPLQWQSTCDRALRLARDVTAPSVPFASAEAVSSGKAGKEEVERIIAAFRARLTRSSSSTEFTSYNVSEKKVVLEDVSFEVRDPHPKEAPLVTETITTTTTTTAKSIIEEPKKGASLLGSFWDVFGASKETSTTTTHRNLVEVPAPVVSEPVAPQPPAIVIEAAKEVVFQPSFPTAPPPTPIALTASTTTTTETTENKWLSQKKTFAEVVKTDISETITKASSAAEFETIPLTASVVEKQKSVKELSETITSQMEDPSHIPTPAFTPRRSSLLRKKPEEHFKTIVTTTTTKTVKGENGEEEVVVVDKNVEVLEEKEAVPKEVLESKQEVVTVVTETGLLRVEDETGFLDGSLLSHKAKRHARRLSNASAHENVVAAVAAATGSSSAVSEKNTMKSVVDTVATAVESVAESVAQSASAIEQPKKKKRVLRNKFAPTGPGMIYSDNDFTDEEDETEVVKTKEVVKEELKVDVHETNKQEVVGALDSASSTPKARDLSDAPRTPVIDSNSSTAVTETVKDSTKIPSYARATASSTHHAHEKPAHHHHVPHHHGHTPHKDKMTKSQMLATVQAMQAEMDAAARKRAASVVDSLFFLVPRKKLKLSMKRRRRLRLLKSRYLTSRLQLFQKFLKSRARSLKRLSLRMKLSTIKFKSKLSRLKHHLSRKRKSFVLAANQVSVPKREYSETYRNHISESDTVLSVCETELKSRYSDYKQFSQADLMAWMEEIKSTAMMFVDIGGQVLEAEWKEHGFSDNEVAPHLELVSRAKRICDELEAFRAKI
ncbi:hypothetical protein BCR33DRAFT_716497 [Rhizoclosmatium globosum]|uniref:Uncharacterized protein n=1 Tax=Rhizoclosmatium globosum TaxID=329046 RepID=A0A1Y2CDQ5_9FUNG|nr:hypothetical protein BCR33DRAFT_716497 [Rhizoclosmatium globosum]|eukprot:ORY45169.1 hypothetical protein BCR33DRAFT_716497 [Rhizoclosmatium globosum]